MWSQGNNSEYKFCIKHFDEPSEFGINGGRISKLWMERDGITVCSYDRGWDIEPIDEEALYAYEMLLERYN